MPEELIGIFVVFIVIGIPVICMTIIQLAKIIKGDTSKKGRHKYAGMKGADWGMDPDDDGDLADEARLVQEMHRGLDRLEKRIENLEDIVLKQDQQERSKRVSTHE